MQDKTLRVMRRQATRDELVEEMLRQHDRAERNAWAIWILAVVFALTFIMCLDVIREQRTDMNILRAKCAAATGAVTER